MHWPSAYQHTAFRFHYVATLLYIGKLLVLLVLVLVMVLVLVLLLLCHPPRGTPTPAALHSGLPAWNEACRGHFTRWSC